MAKKKRTRKSAAATPRRRASATSRSVQWRDRGEDLERPRVPNGTWRRLIFQTFGHQRFTQDSPIVPDVWMLYAKANLDVPVDLIMTPRAGHAPGQIAALLSERLKQYRKARGQTLDGDDPALIAYSRSSVVAKLTFNELMQVVVPMTSWWRSLPEDYRSYAQVAQRLKNFKGERVDFKKIVNATNKWEYYRFLVLAGFISKWRELPDPEDVAEILQSGTNHFGMVRTIAHGFLQQLESIKQLPATDKDAEIWSVSHNRRSSVAVYMSRPAIKADAAQNVFNISTKGLAWAVIDCGIDATHPAFLDRDRSANHPVPARGQSIPLAHSRIEKTYDFTVLRSLLASSGDTLTDGTRTIELNASQKAELVDLRRRINLGREIDWALILPMLEIPHVEGKYVQPTNEHGTHVAGILSGWWPAAENEENADLFGVCRDLRIFDFRVFDSIGDTDEFIIMAALQVVAHLNRFRDKPVIHGVNLSLSLRHEVMSFACGRTPICDECSRLVGDGVVVVAAAGNQGFNDAETGGGQFGSYRVASITDPGNAEAVITVGSTHRNEPHAYGVSYFSSRGPTGDGRSKPDLVAPGEKITAPIPNCGSKRMDGTSMAAPHVSGAAALLMARHRELVGRPMKIKDVLCKSATNLGRESNFQGAGMLDILRALQLV
ncbi:MAG: S8 family serine peptidase [Pseudolabrys sp.]|nr:S8 family serine peptidase [Pseudolabrys sp.]MDP2295777.1 S8 family serine peptidase [Pseudolabrys sp.]